MFQKYNSIENHYRTKFIEKIQNHPQTKNVVWIAREKIHGTNLSFIIDKDDRVIVAKRGGMLGSDEASCSGFFRADLALKDARVFMPLLKEFLQQHYTERKIKTVQMFGEWFGGGGEHPRVQKGVFYCEHLQFAAFDILVTFAEGSREYLDEATFVSVTRTIGIFVAPLIGVATTLDKALEINNMFDSTVPQFFGAHVVDNIAEGLVIKPSAPLFMPDGTRVIIKSKNDKWKEKDHKNKAPKQEVVVPENVQKLLELGIACITEHRLENVVSKIGPGLKPNAYIQPYVADVLVDLEKEAEDENIEMSKDDWKMLKKLLPKHIVDFLLKRM